MNSFRIVKNNFKRSYNRKAGFIVNLVIPIIVVILGIFANNASQPSFIVGVIGGEHSPDIVNTLLHTDGITIGEANQDTIKIDLITGKFSAVVSFSNSTHELFSIKDEKTNEDLKQIIDSYKTTTTPVSIEKIIGVEMSMAERTIAFIVLFLMVTSTVTASTMIKDKNNGTLIRYKYSPQKPINYIAGNFIYNFLITFLQFFISVTFIQLLRIDMGISYGNLMLTGIWLSGIATAFGTFFSSIFQKEMYANLFATFTALILSLVGGTFIAFDKMPTMLQKISIISPFRWFIEATKNMGSGIGWFENTEYVVTLSVMIFVLLTAASLISKKQKNFK